MILETETLTPLQKDKATTRAKITDIGKQLSRVAGQMAFAHKDFWNLPTERLLALLNDDVGWTLQVFAANTTTAMAINSQLALLGSQFPMRAPTTIGRDDITFNGTAFVVVLPEPAPEPAPEPTPDPAPEA